jgi:hypothetical protein
MLLPKRSDHNRSCADQPNSRNMLAKHVSYYIQLVILAKLLWQHLLGLEKYSKNQCGGGEIEKLGSRLHLTGLSHLTLFLKNFQIFL